MNNQDIKILNKLLLRDIQKILGLFKIEYQELSDRYQIRCPIHNGKKLTSCSIYKDSGLWYCWTHSCHENIQSNLFALFKNVLKFDTNQMHEWCRNLFQDKITHVEIDCKQNKFMNMMEILDKKLEKVGISPKVVRESLDIPSKYFLNRGFLPETLIKYDVGDCYQLGKPMYKRAVVPVYDEDYSIMTGCIGRRIDDSEENKWKNSYNFRKSENLYNIWFAKEEIKQTNTIVVVEGQGDVWRLCESGIKNVVGIFGANISDNQMFLLENLPIFNMVVLTDSDEAGVIAKNKIIEKCSRLYNIKTVDLPKKDIGDMSIEEVKSIILPVMEKL